MTKPATDFFRVPDDAAPLSFGDFVIAPHVALGRLAERMKGFDAMSDR
jgi:hypothetical protein